MSQYTLLWQHFESLRFYFSGIAHHHNENSNIGTLGPFFHFPGRLRMQIKRVFHFRLVLLNNFRFSDCRLPWKISFSTRVNSLGFNMADMSMVEILKTWHEGVSLMEKGNFQDALMNFIALEGRTDSSQTLITSGRNLFNIGQTYRALGNLDRAAKVLNCLWQSFRDFGRTF